MCLEVPNSCYCARLKYQLYIFQGTDPRLKLFHHRYLKDINNILNRRSKNIEECEINIRDIFIFIARATEYHDYPLLLKNENHFEKNRMLIILNLMIA